MGGCLPSTICFYEFVLRGKRKEGSESDRLCDSFSGDNFDRVTGRCCLAVAQCI